MIMRNTLDNHVVAYEGDNIYDFDNEILLTWYPQRIIEHTMEALSLLELGVGHGYTTNIFSERFKRHVVLDGSPAVIANFKKRYPDCKADIIEIYFENFDTKEKFDVIVMGFILEHVDNPVDIMARFKKFLAPGGTMYIAVPNAEVLNRRLGNLAGMLPNIEELSDNDRMLGHQRYYTVETLTLDIGRAGYEVKKMEGIYLKPFATRQIVALKLDRELVNSLCKVGVSYPELSCGILAELKEKK